MGIDYCVIVETTKISRKCQKTNILTRGMLPMYVLVYILIAIQQFIFPFVIDILYKNNHSLSCGTSILSKNTTCLEFINIDISTDISA